MEEKRNYNSYPTMFFAGFWIRFFAPVRHPVRASGPRARAGPLAAAGVLRRRGGVLPGAALPARRRGALARTGR